jgi:hypothetical protein
MSLAERNGTVLLLGYNMFVGLVKSINHADVKEYA